jgi:hypothetical protein
MKALFGTLAAIALASAAATAGAGPEPDAKPIHVQGCVEAGVEASCLVLKDIDSGKLYNLFVKGDKPAVGAGIEFTGIPFKGITTCMQGAPIKVATWTRKDSLKCAQGKVHAE